MRKLLCFAVAISAGCVSQLTSRYVKNEKGAEAAAQLLAAGKFAECRDSFDAVVREYDDLSPLCVAKGGSADCFPFDRAKARHGRALCNKGAGRLPEAVADMRASVDMFNAECERLTKIGNRLLSDHAGKICRQRADDLELLAKWRKEAAK